MSFESQAAQSFNEKLVARGRDVRFAYFTITTGSGYDDDVTLTLSGTATWAKAMIFPVDSSDKNDALMFEAGKVTAGDIKVFVNGSQSTNTAGGVNVSFWL